MNEAHVHTSASVPASSVQGGLTFSRRFSSGAASPYDEVQWEFRTASITDSKGNTIFEQKDVEVPIDWSMTATNIVASKYLHGQLGTAERETGVRQLVERVAETVRRLGDRGRLLCHPRGCSHLLRRAGAHAADAEGGLQLAGVVQRGLRPVGAEFGRTKLALGPGDRGREVLRHGLSQPAVLGLLYQRRR